jgi:hypothetical protein
MGGSGGVARPLETTGWYVGARSADGEGPVMLTWREGRQEYAIQRAPVVGITAVKRKPRRVSRAAGSWR